MLAHKISGQPSSNCGTHGTVGTFPDIPTPMSSMTQMGTPCQDTAFKNTHAFLPCAEIYQIDLGKHSFLQEGPDQTDINIMNSSQCNLLSPSSSSPYSETDSGTSCSFFHYPDPLQYQHQQQQHFQSFSNQHHPCSTQCNHNCISDNIACKNNEALQYKTDCSSADKNLIYDQGWENTYLSIFNEEDVCLEKCNIELPMNVDCSDSAFSRSNSRSSHEDVFHPSFLYDQQYDNCDYQQAVFLTENVNIKREACPVFRDNEIQYHQQYKYNNYGCYGPTECASSPQFYPNGNYPVASYTVKQSLDLQHISIRHGSPNSDEGFDEPSIPEEALPRFLNIQHFTDSDRDSHSGHSTSLTPKEKRKIDGQLVPSIEKERRKPGRKPGQVSNVLHLWEFMRDLLHSPDGRGIIEWVSRQEGVFRVLNSSEVARLWGEKKKNKKQMTYEKLSRSLRYSRLEGYFADLPKDKNYPKKLCFKFGSKAKNWR